MQIRSAALAFALASVVAVGAESQTQPAAEQAPSLYKRLGGFDAIAAVVDDFVPRLAADPQVGHFFASHSNDSKLRIRQLAIDYFCQKTGGPCVYIGRDLKVTHAGLGIAESDWQVSVKHLETTLDKFKVPAKERAEFLALVGGLKGQVVEKP
jgi:hemoglobin